MNEDQFAFFKRLVETTGPSGYEEQTQQVWRDRVQSAADTVTTDVLGSCTAMVNPSGRPRVMLDGHIDEIGFLIKHIDDNGFIYFNTIGGFDPSTLPGNRVRFIGKQGPVLGVIGRKPTHLIEPDERKKMPEIKSMWIDIGAGSREEAETLLSIGDAGGRAHNMERLHRNLVTSKTMDNRVGCYIVAETLRELAASRPKCAVYGVSSVQEEIGLRGAQVSAYASEADIGVALEVTWTSDHPLSSKTELGDIKLGNGPVIVRGANGNPRIFERLVQAARDSGTPYQVDALASGTPTDQNIMQRTRAGMATGLMSVPTRYIHTASETLSTDDVDAAVTILTRFVRDIDDSINLIP